MLTKRIEKYGLTLHPEKTRLIEFGREALAKSEEGEGRSQPRSTFWVLRMYVREAGEGTSRCMSGP